MAAVTTTPIEAGLHWAVAFGKGRFVGRDMLAKQKEQGPRRVLDHRDRVAVLAEDAWHIVRRRGLKAGDQSIQPAARP